MTLQWSKELAVGYPAIDRQHQELIDRFNTFLDACNERRGKEQLSEMFGFLDEYVVLHFHAEEELMAQHRYPAINEHRAQHREFTGRLTALREDLGQAGPTIHLLVRTNKALIFWLTNHIKKVDVELARFLAKNAV